MPAFGTGGVSLRVTVVVAVDRCRWRRAGGEVEIESVVGERDIVGSGVNHAARDVGSDAAHPGLCGRCVSNLHGDGEVRTHA